MLWGLPERLQRLRECRTKREQLKVYYPKDLKKKQGPGKEEEMYG